MSSIKTQARDNGFNSFHFSFSGGEPTLHPEFLDIIRFYADDENSNYQSQHMTTNLSMGKRWFKNYAEVSKNLNRVSITASWHREQGIKQGNLDKHMKTFAEKINFLQEYNIQVTINMVMVPEWFDVLWNEALYFHEQNINVTLKPQSNTNATKIVDGYNSDMLEKLHNGLPQRDFTKIKSKIERPKGRAEYLNQYKDNSTVPQVMQIELEDSKGNKWFLDQAERFNAFNFNNFKGWVCNAGFQGIIIREPDGMIKRSYSCADEPIGHITEDFKIFDKPKICITPNCVSSADSKIPKFKK